jgi:hypothetical protein
MNPSFDIPPQYFYGLAAGLPADVTADVRYRLATLSDEKTIVEELRRARENGSIVQDPNITLEMAARRLRALGAPSGGAVLCAPGVGFALVQAYANHETGPPPELDPEDDIAPFWNSVMGNAALAAAHLELVLCAVTLEPDSRPLIGHVRDAPPAGEGLALDDVRNIDPNPWPGAPVPALDYGDWQAVFTSFPADLPALTAPGTLEERIGAFVRRLRQFFDVASTGIGPSAVIPGTPPTLPSPAFDPIGAFLASYVAQVPGFTWGTPFNAAFLSTALASVPMDATGKQWLENVVQTINDLASVTSIGVAGALQFSLIESLFARGFTRASQIASLSPSEFGEALIGAPAYAFAVQIYAAADGGGGQPVVSPGPFVPVNDGSLADCLPPCGHSPLGTIAYLHDLLRTGLKATCDDPTEDEEGDVIGGLVASRRGGVGELAVSCANAETPIPVIDLVNECLERIVATGAASGAAHDTASADLAGHRLRGLDQPEDAHAVPFAHDPAILFAALPEHSSPATPVKEPAAYATLRADFSAPPLPYSQELDVNRSYLDAIGTSRFAVMRRFRRYIGEFLFATGAAEPAAFPRHVWRYPVRIDIAREYVLIDADEYDHLFTTTPSGAFLASLYGFPAGDPSWTSTVLNVSEFLPRTGLAYCDLVDLWHSGFVPFHARFVDQRVETDPDTTEFPECEPCYLESIAIVFDDVDAEDALAQLAVFIRLWRKLRLRADGGYTFVELGDICTVLGLFDASGTVNPDFVRQLVAFQMLRDDFQLPLRDLEDVAPGTGADRTHLLALWAPWAPGAPRKWTWAVGTLMDGLEPRVCRDEHLHRSEPRPPEFRKLLFENLNPLSLLAGFDTGLAHRSWHARPTHTLRFAEQLAKVWASEFGVGELLYLFTADSHVGGDDPFPLQDENEARDDPLEHPDQEVAFWLWGLRRKLLEVEPDDEEVGEWTWGRITKALSEDLQLTAGPNLETLVGFAERFFPSVLEAQGIDVPPARRRFEVALAGSSSAMWNTPPSPFEYDEAGPAPSVLRAHIPLRDEAVLTKLSRIRPLSGPERQAVRNLYSLPRLDLARHAYLFPNLTEAHERLVEEPNEQRRWAYFRRCAATFMARCQVTAGHLAEHVDSAIGHASSTTSPLAWTVLCRLLADENKASPPPWDRDDGTRPAVTWTPGPGGGAFAALVGLVGTGLRAEYTVGDGATVVWRDLRGPLTCFGATANEWNSPVPTILPALDADLPVNQQRWASVRNGIALHATSARRLGGIQPYCIRLEGALLVEHDGSYQFWAGAPTGEDEEPDLSSVRGSQWRVALRRGQKEWVLLSHDWPDEAECPVSTVLPLRTGAYDLSIEFVQCAPTDDDLEDEHVLYTGFQLKYRGPDTDGRLLEVPRHRLYVQQKDDTLAAGASVEIGAGPLAVLTTRYYSTLRDIRRTYERAFKATLFARRLDLSSEQFADYGQSEFGFLLDHPDKFAGLAFYEDGGWKPHRVNLDPNLLPLRDPYLPPAPAQDDRAAPSVRRRQAWFDVWERLFDYTVLRLEAGGAPEHPAWLLFDEAAENQPDNPAQLLRHLGIDLTHSEGVLRFWQAYDVTAADLVDERWATRVWRADEGVRWMVARFLFTDPRVVRPARWAADAPGVPGDGNEDLTSVVRNGYIENGRPRRYDDLQRLNDRLRERARGALVAYLCGMNRVGLPWGGFARSPTDLSELLLIDVEAGICQRASRVENAISAVQTLVRRARLGLEAGWLPTSAFLPLWDGRFETFRIWQACVRRSLYAENWQEWVELEEARRTEAFRFLEDQLRRATLTKPLPGGLEYWDADELPPHPGLVLLQARRPATVRILDGPREGLDLRSLPAADGQRGWLSRFRSETEPSPDDDLPSGDDTGAILSVDVAPDTAVRAETLPPAPEGSRPLWLEAAVRVGTRFLRVPAAGDPPAAMAFTPPPAPGRERCCRVCGCEHDALIDEYYFWLADRRWYDDVEQVADWPGWHDIVALPALLQWEDQPTVHLMWCWVHNGEILQPQRSVEGVSMPKGTTPGSTELELLGRTADSLLLGVVGGAAPAPAGGYAAEPPTGFRYDLVTDTAHVVPGVELPLPLPPFPGGLTAYPYFAYFDPGAPLFPFSPFSEAVAVASALRAHCHFEGALKWYGVAFDPLHRDNGWCPGRQQPPPGTGVPVPAEGGGGGVVVLPEGQPTGETEGPVGVVVLAVGQPAGEPEGGEGGTGAVAFDVQPTTDHGLTVDTLVMPSPEVRGLAVGGIVDHDGLCCRHAGATPDVARQRAIMLEYAETLLTWADCLLARNAPEAFAQARVVLDTARRILGPTPRTVELEEEEGPKLTVRTFVPAGAPLNPRLMVLYERVEDRLSLIRACLNGRRLRNGIARRDMPYFGDDPARDGWNVLRAGCECGMGECCCPTSPYRFFSLVRRAAELAGVVRGLGASLLAAYEKGDAEYLSRVRVGHEHQIASLLRDIRQDQWRDADWQVQALQKSKEIAQTHRRYYGMLVTNGLIAGELDYQALTNSAIGALTSATVTEAIATVLGIIPDLFVGTVNFAQIAIGSKLAGVFQGIARISSQTAQILSTTAGLRLTQAGWVRREDEWRHQIDIFDLEIEQIERQILGAERRRSAALRELNSQEQTIANTEEVLDFLRDKFTSQELFLWLQRETAALHRGMYELALCAAEQAERAFNFERGYTVRRFLPDETWDNLRDGMLAGERLELAVRHMESAFLLENVREYELLKHVSLRLHFPEAFLAVKLTGTCIVELPEWLFDLDYPGHYMRRLKSVSLTIPAVVGPYTGVHCRLTLLSSATRVDPRLHEPIAPCCPEPPPPGPEAAHCDCRPVPPPKRAAPPAYDETTSGYVPRQNDNRIVRQYYATEATATSSGQSDPGLFQLNFQDDRYLPFEFAGAVSRWRLDLPPENNRFDLASLSDVVMHVSFTAREGGDVLRVAASEVAQSYVPGDGERLFEVRNEMPDQWNRFLNEHDPQRLEVRLARQMFPYVMGDLELTVNGFDVFVEANGADPSAHHEVAFVVRHEPRCHRAAEDDYDFECVASTTWPGLFHGSVDVPVLTVRGSELEHLGTFYFEDPFEDVTRVFLIVRYELRQSGRRRASHH